MTRHWSGARPATNRAMNDMTVTPPRIQDLIASIETARAGLLDDARPIAVERVHARGRLSAPEPLAPRIQDGQYWRHFAHASGMFHIFARASGWIPMVALMLGAGFAGPTNYAGLADFVVMVRGLSTMGLAGPALVKAATGEDTDNMSLGGADLQVDRVGLADLGVEDEDAAFDAAKRFLSYLPSNSGAERPTCSDGAEASRIDDAILDLVPTSARKVYDVRKVLAMIADRGSVFELKPTFAGNLLTAFSRLGGRPVGFIANQPQRLGARLDANACDKGAHFLALCDAYGLPLVSFIDVPGFSIGSGAERTNLRPRSAQLILEWGHISVPPISGVLRKGYGLGHLPMDGGPPLPPHPSLPLPPPPIFHQSA